MVPAKGAEVNFQQLRIIRETVRQDFNLTEVANALYTSQSGVSKSIRDLEDELGLELFVRRGKRLIGLTDPGKELVVIVQRVLRDTKSIKQLAQQFTSSDQGELRVAITNAQAHYVPQVVSSFKKLFPRVHLVVHQENPKRMVAMLLDGATDIGISIESLEDNAELVAFPYYSWDHAVITPLGHDLEKVHPLTLADIASYPIVTYDSGLTGRPRIDEAFSRSAIEPDIVMTALDATTIKTYVAAGLGIGIIASMAYDAERDTGLALLPTNDLFERNTSRIAVRKDRYLRGFAYRFIELCSASLTEAVVRQAVATKG
ncbi:MAG: LysR substrate-binding domain-containing protein, partial [Hyphomicrobium sp.]